MVAEPGLPLTLLVLMEPTEHGATGVPSTETSLASRRVVVRQSGSRGFQLVSRSRLAGA